MKNNMTTLLGIAFFGACGTLLRFFMDRLLQPDTPTDFPIHTWVINALGSFAIGAIYVWGMERGGISAEARLVIVTGLLGGFTTFSAYSLQVLMLTNAGEMGRAVLYGLGCPITGVLSAWLGALFVRTFWVLH